MDTTSSNGTEMLQARLSQPQVAKALARILDRLDALEKAVDALADAVVQLPQMTALAADSLDEAVGRLQARGIDPEERLREGLTVLEKATRPENVRVLSALLDRMDRVEQMLELVDQAPQVAALAADSLDEAYMELREVGVDPETLVRGGLRVAAKLSQLMASPEYDALLESGILEPRTLKAMGAMGQALAEAQAQPPPRLGPWGLLRALGDAHVQRATGFLVRFAQAFGARLGQGTS